MTAATGPGIPADPPLTLLEQTSITITAKQLDGGLFVSLATQGPLADEMLDRRFYSIPEMPPKGIEPRHFWGTLMYDIAGFISHDD